MNTTGINLVNDLNFPNSIISDGEYISYIKLLNDNATLIAKRSLGVIDINLVNRLIDLLEAYDGNTLFLIQYTNSTAEIIGFAKHDQALKYAPSDHLLNLSPLKMACF